MMMRARAIFTLLSVVLMVAIGPTVGFTKDHIPHPLNVTGRWVIVSSACADLTAVLIHKGTAINGTVSDADNYPTGISGTSSMPAGSKSDSRNVSLTVTFSDGLSVTFDGTVNADNTTITGTYHNAQGFSDPFTARRQ
jgi:hypothetical protein